MDMKYRKESVNYQRRNILLKKLRSTPHLPVLKKMVISNLFMEMSPAGKGALIIRLQKAAANIIMKSVKSGS